MPKTVLTIDDDTSITDMLAILLSTYGFEVITANSGEEGYKAIQEKNPHIVILDLLMPGSDGQQVCKNVRTLSNVPILILSAIDDSAMVARVLDSGADDYLVKPVTSSVLVAYINRLIHRTDSLNESNRMAIHPTRTQPQIS